MFDFLFESFGSVVGVSVVVQAVLLLFPFAYVMLKWRSGPELDLGMGTRAGLYFLRSLALLTFLFAVSALLQLEFEEDIPKEMRESQRRDLMGFALGALVAYLIQFLLAVPLPRWWRRGEDPARRVFLGFVGLVSGVVSMGLVVFLCYQLLQKHVASDSIRDVVCWLVVWLPVHVGVILYLVVTIPARKEGGGRGVLGKG